MSVLTTPDAMLERAAAALKIIDDNIGYVADAKTYAERAEAAAELAVETVDGKADKIDVEANSNRIDNIAKLLEGTLFDYSTDSTTAYVKTVPSGALPYASLDKLGGKTLVWNQLADTTGLSSQTSSDVNFTLNNNGSYTISGTASSRIQTYIVINRFYSVVGHKYLVHLSQPFSDGGNLVLRFASGFNTNTTSASAILECTTETNLYAYFDSITDETGTTYSYTNVFIDIHDLTLMFGAGNEPSTVAEFEAMFPSSYYAYNEGTLLSAGVTEVESVGVNLINENNYQSGIFNASTGVISFSSAYTAYDIFTGTNGASTAVSDVSKILKLEAGTYTFAVDNISTGLRIDTVGADGTILADSYSVINSSTKVVTLTFTERTYITFRGSSGDNSITKLRVVKGSSDLPYAPYFKNTYSIPASVQALTGYGWSAGSAYNYIDFERKVFVQRVARVYLGTISYAKVVRTNYDEFQTEILRSLIKIDYTNPNIITTSYTPHAWSGKTVGDVALNSSGDVAFCVTTNQYADATAFKTTMNGQYLYYELATPVETDISQYLTDDNLVEVEAGGTLTFPNSNGNDYQIPVPSEEIYMIDIQEAI